MHIFWGDGHWSLTGPSNNFWNSVAQVLLKYIYSNT